MPIYFCVAYHRKYLGMLKLHVVSSLEINQFILESQNGTSQILETFSMSLAKAFNFRAAYHVGCSRVNSSCFWSISLLQKDIVFLLIKASFSFVFVFWSKAIVASVQRRLV